MSDARANALVLPSRRRCERQQQLDLGSAKVTYANQLQFVLSRLVALLRVGGNDNWAKALEDFEVQAATEPSATSARILAVFGGMGSLNDVILYRGGQPLSKENEELDRLRTELYELCRRGVR